MQKALFIALVFCFSMAQGKIISQKTELCTQESVHGSIFKHVIISTDHVEEQFFMDDIPLLKDMYYEKLHAAELVELQEKRKIKDGKMLQQAQSFADTQVQAAIKVAQSVLTKVQEMFGYLQMSLLQKYIVFSPSAVASVQQLQELTRFVGHCVGEMEQAAEQKDTAALFELTENLEHIATRAEACLQATVSKAIEHCDDTYALKELFRIAGTLQQD